MKTAWMVFLALIASTASAAGIEQYSVSTKTANVRDQPIDGEVVNALRQGQIVTVYSTRGAWALISAPGEDEQWVSMKLLSKKGGTIARGAPRGPAVASNSLEPRPPAEPLRAYALPAAPAKTVKVAAANQIAGNAFADASKKFSAHDVDVLKRGANKVLENGRCQRVDYAYKSTMNPGEYYVFCGNNKRLIFSESLRELDR